MKRSRNFLGRLCKILALSPPRPLFQSSADGQASKLPQHLSSGFLCPQDGLTWVVVNSASYPGLEVKPSGRVLIAAQPCLRQTFTGRLAHFHRHVAERWRTRKVVSKNQRHPLEKHCSCKDPKNGTPSLYIRNSNLDSALACGLAAVEVHLGQHMHTVAALVKLGSQLGHVEVYSSRQSILQVHKRITF